jgi:hypothetical protein
MYQDHYIFQLMPIESVPSLYLTSGFPTVQAFGTGDIVMCSLSNNPGGHRRDEEIRICLPL